ncbi:isochorismatase hydrolase [Biscogniauxia mediterranea]|nr:isochorismatase hydrolase [Biscogniauxia mediterranea]
MDKSALIVLDVQNGIVEHLKAILDETQYLDRLAATIAAARAAQIPVIQVTVALREGYADASPRNKMFAGARESGGFRETQASTQLHPRVLAAHEQLHDPPIQVRKRRVSALCGTDLEVVLRSLGAGALVVAGISTSGAVLSTVRQAADLDYGLTVLADLCADQDPEVHDVLLRSVFPKQATVLSAAEWMETLRK